jgi:hypothetical protein
MGRNQIEAVLRHQMPQRTWTTQYYDDSRFLVEAPNPRWFYTVTSHGYLRLDNSDLPIAQRDLTMDKSARLQPVWVLVRGFPMEL